MLMPSHPGPAAGHGKTDPFMGTIVLCLFALAFAVTGLAAGMTWERLVHWTGGLLLISGVLLAAKGISDVRREWTGLPGITKSVMLRYRSVSGPVVSFLWLCWNRRLEGWPWLARLGLRIHQTHVHGDDVSVGLDTAQVRVEARPVRPVVTDGDTEQRLAQLEKRLAELEIELDAHSTLHRREIEDRQAETAQEKAERMAGDQGNRDRMADIAGGGLKLQAWAVVCLLLGTILTAFWLGRRSPVAWSRADGFTGNPPPMTMYPCRGSGGTSGVPRTGPQTASRAGPGRSGAHMCARRMAGGRRRSAQPLRSSSGVPGSGRGAGGI